MLLSHSIGSILLASSFLFHRACGEGRREIIGYRTLPSKEAGYTNDYERPYRDEELGEKVTPAQIGAGFYVINEPVGWRAGENEWYCVLEADSEMLKKMSKVWIPKSYTKTTGGGETQLWDRDEETPLLEYIESMVPKSDPKKALRFSAIPSVPGKVQMLIPTDAIDNDELGMWSQCWDTEEELRSVVSVTVDWMSWGIAGPRPSGVSTKAKGQARWYQRWLDRWRSWRSWRPLLTESTSREHLLRRRLIESRV